MRDACRTTLPRRHGPTTRPAAALRPAKKNAHDGIPITRPMTSGKTRTIEMDVHNPPTALPRTGDNATTEIPPPVTALLWEPTRRHRAAFFAPSNLYRSKHLAASFPLSHLVAPECNP
jgi:hypothetical protein